jgi:hypothetical protein
MTRLLFGFTGGLYRFDLDASGGPGPVLPGVQPMAFAMDPRSQPERSALLTTGDFGAVRMRVRRGCPSEPRRASLKDRPAVRLSRARRPSCRWIPFLRQMAGMQGGSARSRAAYTVPWIMATRSNSCPLSTCLQVRVGSFHHGPWTHHVQCIAHTSDSCMHLAIEAGAMIRSHDNGETFKDRLPDSPVDTTRASHPSTCSTTPLRDPGRRITETGKILCRKPGRRRYLGLLGQGAGSSALLVRPRHSSQQSRGHSGRPVAEPQSPQRAHVQGDPRSSVAKWMSG